jgi:hypothetical protein
MKLIRNLIHHFKYYTIYYLASFLFFYLADIFFLYLGGEKRLSEYLNGIPYAVILSIGFTLGFIYLKTLKKGRYYLDELGKMKKKY